MTNLKLNPHGAGDNYFNRQIEKGCSNDNHNILIDVTGDETVAMLQTYYFHINHPQASCVSNWYLQLFGSKLLLFYVVWTLPSMTWRLKYHFILYCDMYVPYRLFPNSCFIFLHCNIISEISFSASYKFQQTWIWRLLIFSATVSMFLIICDMNISVCSLYHWIIYKLKHSFALLPI